MLYADETLIYIMISSDESICSWALSFNNCECINILQLYKDLKTVLGVFWNHRKSFSGLHGYTSTRIWTELPMN